MAQQGASFQSYNNELVKYIEELKEKQKEINTQIIKEEEERESVRKQIAALNENLSKIEESLARKKEIRSDFERTMEQTQKAYSKILESTKALLQLSHRFSREKIADYEKQL